MKNPFAQKILFLKVKNQDPEAFAKFYDLYITRIYRFIFFKVNSVSDAQDLTSEVFLKMWQCVKDGKEIRNFNSFIYIIARNSVIDFYRRKSREDYSLEDPNTPEMPDEKKNLLNQEIINSNLKEILAGLENLKDEYKEVLILKFLDELSVGEIADIINKSNGATRVLIHRALKALKDNLSNKK